MRVYTYTHTTHTTHHVLQVAHARERHSEGYELHHCDLKQSSCAQHLQSGVHIKHTKPMHHPSAHLRTAPPERCAHQTYKTHAPSICAPAHSTSRAVCTSNIQNPCTIHLRTCAQHLQSGVHVKHRAESRLPSHVGLKKLCRCSIEHLGMLTRHIKHLHHKVRECVLFASA